ncbi:cyclin-dependent kinase G-2-like [Malania oleifera]|uniref:cyclin-dependent kinase G-2-like n=1 Tax=Malania oleifera TaxID=397392 RepID=UPI0025ADFA01|nr:cyclin-dependent kinase G-2-like [Malania oleifera]
MICQLPPKHVISTCIQDQYICTIAFTSSFVSSKRVIEVSRRFSLLSGEISVRRSFLLPPAIACLLVGRCDVLRRGDDCKNYLKKEHGYYGARDRGFRLGRGGRDQFIEYRSDDTVAYELGLRDSEVSRVENEQSSRDKKRKFSPIVWDGDKTEVRVSSKNRIITPSYSQSQNVSSDSRVRLYPVAENKLRGLQISPVESPVPHGSACSAALGTGVGSSSLVSQERCGDKEQVEEECVRVHNISTSRWASENDSPRDLYLSNEEDMPKRQGMVSHMGSSSPECGEFLREDSKGDRSRSSESDECSEFASDKNDFMEIDKEHDENAGIDNFYSSSDDDDDYYGDNDDDAEPVGPMQGSINMLQSCRSVFEYERLNKINEGTYGVVYKARDKKTGETMALKKVKMGRASGREGFPMSSLREINILLSFDHPSIVGVKEVVTDESDGVFMVMDYMEHDLKGVMEKMKQPFSTSEVKCLMLQLLEGVKYLHDNWVIHRDLKTSNILLNNKGELKICDFGLSRQYGSPLKPYTPLVVTLWYRAPELLLGEKQYSTAIDMWSVGCIMAELLLKEPLFKGETEVDQLRKIYRTLGSPNEAIWPGFYELPGAKANFFNQPYNMLRKVFPAASFTGSPVLSDSGFDLLSKLLTYDPDKRITAEAALNHIWFHEVPLPKSKDFMPTFPVQHAQDRPSQRSVKSPDPLLKTGRGRSCGEGF